MTDRAFGWRQDRDDDRDFRFASGDPTSGTVSVLQYRSERWFQGPVSACVGFALARAIHISLLAHGFSTAPRPSPAYLYFNARAEEYAGTTPGLIEDTGCYPRNAMQAVRADGFCREEDWPYEPLVWSPLMRTTRPRHRAYMRAYDQRMLSYYRIDSTGSQRVADYRRALSQKHAVIFGLLVDSAYLDLSTSEPVQQIDLGDVQGAHMQCILEDDGEAALVDNWWPNWGFDDGFGRLSHEMLQGPWIGDMFAIQAAPLYT